MTRQDFENILKVGEHVCVEFKRGGNGAQNDTFETICAFLNRFGGVHNQGTLNKALRRIIRDCNEKILAGSNGGEVTMLPRFSCHSLRHTFATRLCESGINIKVIQDVMGHADFGTTMNIYTDVTKDLKKQEFGHLEEYLDKKHTDGDDDGTGKS